MSVYQESWVATNGLSSSVYNTNSYVIVTYIIHIPSSHILSIPSYLLTSTMFIVYIIYIIRTNNTIIITISGITRLLLTVSCRDVQPLYTRIARGPHENAKESLWKEKPEMGDESGFSLLALYLFLQSQVIFSFKELWYL